MAVELVRTCDPCGDKDVRTPGAPVTVLIGRGKPRTIDLCPEHAKELIVPLEQAIAAWGVVLTDAQPVRAPREPKEPRERKRAPGGGGTRGDGAIRIPRDLRVACPFEGCDKPEPGHLWRPDNLRKHFESSHGVEGEAEVAILRVQAVEAAMGVELPFRCDMDPCNGRYGAAAAQGLGAHQQAIHGVAGTSIKTAKRKRRAAAR